NTAALPHDSRGKLQHRVDFRIGRSGNPAHCECFILHAGGLAYRLKSGKAIRAAIDLRDRYRNLVSSLERKYAAFKRSGKTEKSLKCGWRMGHRFERVRNAAVFFLHCIEQFFRSSLGHSRTDGLYSLRTHILSSSPPSIARMALRLLGSFVAPTGLVRSQ